MGDATGQQVTLKKVDAGTQPVTVTEAAGAGPDALAVRLAEAKALAVANPERLKQAAEILPDLPQIETVILCEPDESEATPDLPDGVALMTLEEVRANGRNATSDQSGEPGS